MYMLAPFRIVAFADCCTKCCTPPVGKVPVWRSSIVWVKASRILATAEVFGPGNKLPVAVNRQPDVRVPENRLNCFDIATRLRQNTFGHSQIAVYVIPENQIDYKTS